ncbi:MAG: 23S rRNA (uracil(1939)-C(5))-methyltransferase RlmD [Erysipelotrichaceae bacterium]
MLKNGQRMEAKITKLNKEGVAELLINKDRLFVNNVLAGERVQVEVVKQIREGYIGKVVRVLQASPQRCQVGCPIYERCGSCHLLHQHYQAQLDDKTAYVKQLVNDAKLTIKVAPTQGMDNPYAYRNKIIIGYAKDKNRRLISGFYEEYSHTIIPFTRCLLHEEKTDLLLQSIHKILEKYRVEPYDASRRTGLIRHVLIRRGFVSDETMVVLVVGKRDPLINNIAKEIIKQNPHVTTILQNVNGRKTSIVLGDEEKVLYGKGFIVDELCGLTFKISAKSFYQINHDQTQKLYDKAISLLELDGKQTILDAYSGIGTIGLIASKHAQNVISVELNKDAVQDAIQNAKMNQVKNVRFFNEDATKFMMSMATTKKQIDALIIDPPRSGSTPEFIKAAVQMKPKKISYVSCNPLTLVRDLELFKRHGYIADVIYPYDMFPQTRHVEAVVLLTKK